MIGKQSFLMIRVGLGGVRVPKEPLQAIIFSRLHSLPSMAFQAVQDAAAAHLH